MKLIEAIRMARSLGFEWLAIDKDTEIYGFKSEPTLTITGSQWKQTGECEYIGDHDYEFDWIGSIVKLSDIKVK